MLLNTVRATEMMGKYGLDALIASTSGNVAYASDFWPQANIGPGAHQMFGVLPREDVTSASLVIPIGDLAAWINHKCWINDIYPYGIYWLMTYQPLEGDEKLLKEMETDLLAHKPRASSAAEALVHALKAKGLDKATLGIDELHLNPATFDAIRAALPAANFKRAYEIFREIRFVKTPEEIRRLTEATRMTENAIREVYRHLRPGVTERELVAALKTSMVCQGGTPVLWFVGCGTASAFTDREATDYQLKKGDWIMLDVGTECEHYNSDVARSVVFGEASGRQREYYQAIYDGRQKALDAIRPGVPFSRIFQIAVEEIQKGIPQFRRHLVGHGMGVEPYDPPYIAPQADIPIVEGMVLNVETPYYELGWGGIQLEDTILVTSDGFRFITELERELQVIG